MTFPARKKKLLTLVSAVLIILTVIVWYFNFSKFKICENVSVECHYMSYACGDCYPQYKVTSVKPASLKHKLAGKDIDIEFFSQKEEEAFDKKAGNCLGCNKYTLTGDLYYSEKMDCYVLKIKKYKVILRKGCCSAVLDQKLDPHTDIREYLEGDFPNLEYKGIPIFLKDLANHTSTISRIFPNMWERPEYDSLNALKGYNRSLLYEGLHAMKMDTFPGRVSSYSNMGVALLGTILEDAYDRSWFQLLSDKILDTLQMKETRIDFTGLPDAMIAWPHNDQREPTQFWDISQLPAMGALRSTTSDLARFIQANNDDELPAIALSHQTTFGTIREGMGFNWFIHTTQDGYQVFVHGGGTGGSRSSLECLPALRSGFVILTNSLASRKELEKEPESIIIRFARR